MMRFWGIFFLSFVSESSQSLCTLMQFLSTNKRTDEYGGSVENRSRIIFEILDAMTEVWDSKCVAIKKFSPVM